MGTTSNIRKLSESDHQRQKSNFETLFTTKRNSVKPPPGSHMIPETEAIDKAREIIQMKLDGKTYKEIRAYLFETYGYGSSTMDTIILTMYQEIKKIASEYIETIVIDHFNKYEYLFQEAGKIENEKLQIQVLSAKEKLLGLIQDQPSIKINEFFGFNDSSEDSDIDVNLLSETQRKRFYELLNKTQVQTINI